MTLLHFIACNVQHHAIGVPAVLLAILALLYGLSRLPDRDDAEW